MTERDEDKDGRLAAVEFYNGASDSIIEEMHEKEFKKIDRDGDGYVDKDELQAFQSGHFHTEEAMKHLFGIADKDGNKYVTPTELSFATNEISASDAYFHLAEWHAHEHEAEL